MQDDRLYEIMPDEIADAIVGVLAAMGNIHIVNKMFHRALKDNTADTPERIRAGFMHDIRQANKNLYATVHELSNAVGRNVAGEVQIFLDDAGPAPLMEKEKHHGKRNV